MKEAPIRNGLSKCVGYWHLQFKAAVVWDIGMVRFFESKFEFANGSKTSEVNSNGAETVCDLLVLSMLQLCGHIDAL